jgi:hypothetical protein
VKRRGGLWPEVISFPNLLLAFHKAARAKRDHPNVARFRFHLERELCWLQDELQSRTYEPGPYFTTSPRMPLDRAGVRLRSDPRMGTYLNAQVGGSDAGSPDLGRNPRWPRDPFRSDRFLFCFRALALASVVDGVPSCPTLVLRRDAGPYGGRTRL